ncbi:MAG: general secretion pathway protein D [Akkermansiaceae bacterium]|jgi:general secretion pathway protein D
MKFSLTLLLGLSLGAMAQEPPAPGAPAPQPGVPAPVPNTQPAAPVGGGIVRGRTVDPNGLVVTANDFIQEANITALRAAQLYEDYSGKRVIMTNAVAQSEVSFTMRGPLTNAEAARFLQLTLLAEGLAMMPIPEEPEIVRLIPSGPITAPGQVPKELYFDEFELPVEDQLVMYQMIFKYLKPEEALKVLQSAMGQLSASGTIAAVPNASSLIITESASLIRQMIKIQKAIDVPTPVGERWVEVTYGDVDEIAERMNEIYNEQGSSQQTTRTTRANTPPAPGATPGAATSGEDIPLRIIGVRRTSRILLVGRPTDLIAAESMIQSFDQPSAGNTRQTFRLRYMRVSDFLGIAENAISVTLGEGSTGGGAQGGGGRQLTSQNNNSRNNQTNNNNQTTGQQGGRQGGQGGQGGGGGQSTNLQEQIIPTAPESLLVGRTLLVADNVANTIVVNGPPHHIEIVRDLIGDLDTEAQQVALSAVVGSYGIGDGLNFGLDLARALQRTGSNFAAAGAASFGGVPSIIDPGTLTDLGSVLSANGNSGSGVSVYGLLGDDFGVFVNALETQTKFKTLERTVLTTRNNRVASLSSGQSIAVPSSTFAGGVNQGGVTTNVEFRNVVLRLDIQPLINSDNQVTLEISLVRDSVGTPRVVGELTVPDINTETLTTSVTVQNGSAVILGGIMTTTTSDSQGGVPFLSRIPGIGRIFGRTEQENRENELIIMIQPRILKSQGEMDQFRQEYGRSTLHTTDAHQSFPVKNSGMLPAAGTMPSVRENSKGEGVLPINNNLPTEIESPTKGRSAGRKKSYLR